MKLSESQLRYTNHMKTYDGIFAVMEFQGKLSNREYTKVRYCQKGNLAKLLDLKVLPARLLNEWYEQGILEKKESYFTTTKKFGRVNVTEYHLK